MGYKKLVQNFRDAIDEAKANGEFNDDISFHKFPCGCCGDASDLLAEFLLKNDIETYYVCGTYRDGSFDEMQSHAWLKTEDGMIIDITGDQFRYDPNFMNYSKPVYIGEIDAFHRLFEVENRDVKKNYGLKPSENRCQQRLYELYNTIMKHI